MAVVVDDENYLVVELMMAGTRNLLKCYYYYYYYYYYCYYCY